MNPLILSSPIDSRGSRRSTIAEIVVSLLCLVVSSAASARASEVEEAESDPAPVRDLSQKPFAVRAEVQPLPAGTEYGRTPGDHASSLQPYVGSEVSAIPKRFQYALRLNVRGVYDDNIFLRQTDRVSDFYFAIEPGLTLGFGDIVGREQNSIRLDYAPSIFLYTGHSGANAIQQLIRLEGQYRLSHLSIGLTQDIQLLEGANLPVSTNFGTNPGPTVNIDTGGDTQVNIYTTNATLSYDLTGKTFLSGAMHFTAYDYANLISSKSLQGNAFINFVYSPKLTLGLGGTLGYNWVEGNNPDQTFEQVNLRATYQLTGKVSVDGSIGVEFRQFENDLRGGTYISPVYEIGASYQPFDGTTVTLRGSRRTLNSAVLAAQDYASTNITVGVRQRLLRRIYLSLAGGYEHSAYFNTVEFVSATRSDDYFFFQPAVDFTVTRFWTLGAYYLYRRNESSFNSFGFYDNQVGLRTSLTF